MVKKCCIQLYNNTNLPSFFQVLTFLLCLCNMAQMRRVVCEVLLQQTTTRAVEMLTGGDRTKQPFCALVNWANQPVASQNKVPVLAVQLLCQVYEVLCLAMLPFL